MGKIQQHKMRVNVVHDGQELKKDSICPDSLIELMVQKGLAEPSEILVTKGPTPMKGDLDGDGDVDADDAAIAEARRLKEEADKAKENELANAAETVNDESMADAPVENEKPATNNRRGNRRN